MSIRVKMILSTVVFLVLSVSVLFIVNSLNGNLSSKQNKDNSVKESFEEIKTDVEHKNPLTGLSLEENKVKDRPVAVMINNLHTGQPLLGVKDADIMYECPIEGGITRILAVFKDPYQISSIGSIRSSRPYFISLAKSLDAIYVHLGGSTHAYQILKSGYIDSIDLISNGQFVWRDQNRMKTLGFEHSALTSGEKINAAIESKNYSRKLPEDYKYQQKFSENSSVLEGSDAKLLKVVFSGYKNTEFTYDEDKQTYLISQFNKPQMDDNAKEQNSKPNVILLNVNAQHIDNTELLSLDIIGEGTGKYMSHGKIIDIKWKRNKDTSPFMYYTADDKELVMFPGKIYVCLLAQWSSFELE